MQLKVLLFAAVLLSEGAAAIRASNQPVSALRKLVGAQLLLIYSATSNGERTG